MKSNLLLFAAIASVLILPAVQGCLDADQIISINSIEVSLNITDHKLLNAFTAMCQNRTVDAYTKSEVDTKIDNALALISYAQIEERTQSTIENYTGWFETQCEVSKLFQQIRNDTCSLEARYAELNTTQQQSGLPSEDYARIRSDIEALNQGLTDLRQRNSTPVQPAQDYSIVIGIVAVAVILGVIAFKSGILKTLNRPQYDDDVIPRHPQPHPAQAVQEDPIDDIIADVDKRAKEIRVAQLKRKMKNAATTADIDAIKKEIEDLR